MQPTFKNEIDFLAKSDKSKKQAFDSLCKSIINNYNKLSGEKLSFTIKRDSRNNPAIIALFDKLSHIVFNLYSPQSVPELLNRIVTKPIKVISKPGVDSKYDKPEVYGKGHFRWDFKAYTLNENELQAIRMYLGLHIKPLVEIKKAYSPNMQPKPDFNLITDYNEQAEGFLNWTGTAFKAEFKEHSIYFDGDKGARDIYTITLKNAAHKYRFTFGQSINDTGNTPTPYSVLSCLTKYEVGTFDNFCGDYGYENDSRTAYKTYKAVLKEWKNVERLFNDEQLDALREIS